MKEDLTEKSTTLDFLNNALERLRHCFQRRFFTSGMVEEAYTGQSCNCALCQKKYQELALKYERDAEEHYPGYNEKIQLLRKALKSYSDASETIYRGTEGAQKLRELFIAAEYEQAILTNTTKRIY